MPLPSDLPVPEPADDSSPDDEDPPEGTGRDTDTDPAATGDALPTKATGTALRDEAPVEDLVIIGNHAATPTLEASFSAGDYTGSIPPDVGGAAGPNHLVVVHNGAVRVQNKAGGVLSTVSLNAFWAGVRGTGGAFDPRVLYDPSSNRWVMTAGDDAELPSSGILIGVSETSDPLGVWNLRKVTIDAADLAWADFPTVGYNDSWFVVQTNLFSAPAAGVKPAFARSQIYVFDKAELYAGGAGRFTALTLTDVGGGQAPAIGSPSNPKVMYMLQNWNGNSSGAGFLRLWEIRKRTLSSPGIPPITTIHVHPLGFFSPAGIAWFEPTATNPGTVGGPQLDSTAKLDIGDARLDHVVCRRNGPGGGDFLFAAHTVLLPVGAPTRSAIQFWGVRTKYIAGYSYTVDNVARVDDPTGAVLYAFPSLAVTELQSVVIGFARFSAQSYPGASWAFGWGNDPADTLQMGGILRSGEGPYNNVLSGTENRWGDYTSTCRDPGGTPAIWTIQEYARPPQGTDDQSGRWGTWWGKFELFENRLAFTDTAPLRAGRELSDPRCTCRPGERLTGCGVHPRLGSHWWLSGQESLAQ